MRATRVDHHQLFELVLLERGWDKNDREWSTSKKAHLRARLTIYIYTIFKYTEGFLYVYAYP